MSMELVVLIALGWTAVGFLAALALGKFLRASNPIGCDPTLLSPPVNFVDYTKKNKSKPRRSRASTDLRRSA
jgi:hypothetical protein